MVRFGSIGPPMHPIELFVPGDTYLLDARSLSLSPITQLNETHILRRKGDIVVGTFDAPYDQDVTRFRILETCELVGPDGVVTDVAGIPVPEITNYRYVTLTRNGQVLVPFVRECDPNRVHAISTNRSTPTTEEPDAGLVTLLFEAIFADKVSKAAKTPATHVEHTEHKDALAAAGLTPTLAPKSDYKHAPSPSFCVYYGTAECSGEDAIPSVNAALKRYYTAQVDGKDVTPNIAALHTQGVTWTAVPLKKTAQYDSIAKPIIDRLVQQNTLSYTLIGGAEAVLRNFTYALSAGALEAYAWAVTDEKYKGLPVYNVNGLRFAAGVA